MKRRPANDTVQITTQRYSKKLKCKDIEAALINCNGLTTKAAAALGIQFFALKRAIKENATLERILENAEEINLDFAEDKLRTMIDKEIPSAVFFYLKCKGKKRGYEEGHSSATLPTKPILFKYVPATKADIEAANKKKGYAEVE